MKILTPATWHSRFVQQARWTEQLRSYIFEQLVIPSLSPILEIGSGTGVILSNLRLASSAALCIGLDLRFDLLEYARQLSPFPSPLQADGLHLPFPSATIAASLCHFLLLWVQEPLALLREMIRVTKPGGVVVALAEPDYGGRIDHPMELVQLGQKQAKSLTLQGADAYMGRKLARLFTQAGLENVQSGILGGHWGEPPSAEAWDSEWNTLEQDLEQIIPKEELHALRQLDAAAWQKGERILFIPTFYAWGFVPEK